MADAKDKPEKKDPNIIEFTVRIKDKAHIEIEGEDLHRVTAGLYRKLPKFIGIAVKRAKRDMRIKASQEEQAKRAEQEAENKSKPVESKPTLSQHTAVSEEAQEEGNLQELGAAPADKLTLADLGLAPKDAGDSSK